MQNRHSPSGERKPFFLLKDKGNGGAERDRTADPLLAKQVLSQLSYSPIICPHVRSTPDGAANARRRALRLRKQRFRAASPRTRSTNRSNPKPSHRPIRTMPIQARGRRRQCAGPSGAQRQSRDSVRTKQWWAREDLNFRPHAYQACALTN